MSERSRATPTRGGPRDSPGLTRPPRISKGFSGRAGLPPAERREPTSNRSPSTGRRRNSGRKTAWRCWRDRIRSSARNSSSWAHTTITSGRKGRAWGGRARTRGTPTTRSGTGRTTTPAGRAASSLSPGRSPRRRCGPAGRSCSPSGAPRRRGSWGRSIGARTRRGRSRTSCSTSTWTWSAGTPTGPWTSKGSGPPGARRSPGLPRRRATPKSSPIRRSSSSITPYSGPTAPRSSGRLSPRSTSSPTGTPTITRTGTTRRSSTTAGWCGSPARRFGS